MEPNGSYHTHKSPPPVPILRVAKPIFGLVIALDMFQSIHTFLHFIDIYNDTFKEPPELFKIYSIIGHPNSKFQTLVLTPTKHFK